MTIGPINSVGRSGTRTMRSPFQLFMGLYDTPLPPRPMKRNETSNGSDGIDDINDDSISRNEEGVTTALTSTRRLFEFNDDGTEVNNLLPPLGRSLQYGVDCYYEVTDRLVVNLIDKTDCHPMDATWSLEACKGDITEAWTCISTARRQLLDMIGNANDGTDKNGLSSKASELMIENEYEILKEERLQKEQEDRQRQSNDNSNYLFGDGVADEPWLPQQNPKPIDDEPWFTG